MWRTRWIGVSGGGLAETRGRVRALFSTGPLCLSRERLGSRPRTSRKKSAVSIHLKVGVQALAKFLPLADLLDDPGLARATRDAIDAQRPASYVAAFDERRDAAVACAPSQSDEDYEESARASSAGHGRRRRTRCARRGAPACLTQTGHRLEQFYVWWS